MNQDNAKVEILGLIDQDPELREAFERRFFARRAAHLIQAMREDAGITKSELAARMKVEPPRISEVEKGEGRDGPTFRFMCNAAEACGFRWPSQIGELARLTLPEDQLAAAPEAEVSIGGATEEADETAASF